MAGGSIINRVQLKGTFKGLSRSASRTGLVTTAQNRRRARAYQSRKNSQAVRDRLNNGF